MGGSTGGAGRVVGQLQCVDWSGRRNDYGDGRITARRHAQRRRPDRVVRQRPCRLRSAAGRVLAGHPVRAAELYREAVAREPEHARTWYELGAFYFDYKAWTLAYDALNNSYTYDRFGPASKTCGLLDQARAKGAAAVVSHSDVDDPRQAVGFS